ncbi:MAG: ATP-binding cassette domain-containing protein [Lachnospiraceae bacterium]
MELVIRNIKKDYGKVHALSGISITFTPGLYGLLGPNGAGKSTLINLITDNIARQEGEILLDGKDIKTLGRNYRTVIGYMPQTQGFYNDFSVYAFLMYISRLKGLEKSKAKKRSLELMEAFNLQDKKRTRTGSLSGGMKQRLMLAQALLNDPEILVLDEPTAGVDPQERIRIRNYISMISEGRIVILATHIVSDVEAVANEICLIGNGKIIKNGTPGQLIQDVSEKVYDISADYGKLSEIQEKYIVSNINNREDGVHIKIIAGTAPEGYNYCRCTANLEDVYLNTFNS